LIEFGIVYPGHGCGVVDPQREARNRPSPVTRRWNAGFGRIGL
jgi:hypothetical protein